MKLCRYCCSILHISINDLDDCAGRKNVLFVSWVGPVYLVIFSCWGGPVPYLELFWAGPVKKTTLYASSQTSYLRTHLKTHNGEKSNKCNQCDFAFFQSSNLRTHLKIHSALCSLREQLGVEKFLKVIALF